MHYNGYIGMLDCSRDAKTGTLSDSVDSQWTAEHIKAGCFSRELSLCEFYVTVLYSVRSGLC